MTPEEMRIAIAQSVGYKFEQHATGTRLIHPTGHVINNHYAESWRLPDYCNDLNAIYAAEHTIENKVEWLRIFWRVCNGWDIQIPDDPDCLTNYLINIASATVAQRAEAYLRTKGLWKE